MSSPISRQSPSRTPTVSHWL